MTVVTLRDEDNVNHTLVLDQVTSWKSRLQHKAIPSRSFVLEVRMVGGACHIFQGSRDKISRLQAKLELAIEESKKS
jgi:hypothetical protein